MVGVVQLANTSDCGSEDRGFKPRLSPHIGVQLSRLERRPDKSEVAGSIPATPTNKRKEEVYGEAKVY